MYRWLYWYTPVIPAPQRLRQENIKFKTNLGYIARPCLKTNKEKKMDVQITFQEPAFSSLGHISRSVELQNHIIRIFNFLRTGHVAFCSGYVILHPTDRQ
jgi:hypothetical protein